MGCPSFWEIGKTLTFNMFTHDPDDGVVSDADQTPFFKIYDSLTGGLVDSGNMTKMGGTDTVGLYSGQTDVSQANGYEEGRLYTVYVEAAVDGVIGAKSYGFEVVSGDGWKKMILTGFDAQSQKSVQISGRYKDL